MKKTAIILFLCIFLVSCSKSNDTITFEEEKMEKSSEKETEKISVDVKGAVLYPGVYEFKIGIFKDAITKSGGLL